MKNIMILIAGFIAGVAFCNLSDSRPTAEPGRTTVLLRVDTVRGTRPEIVVVRAAGEFTDRFKVLTDSTGATDSVEATVPCTQAVYAGEGYKAYVSGYRPKLDSIILHHPSATVVRAAPAAERRFSIGVQAGYGLTPRGMQPYVGVGITWKIL
ncbi:MAG: hypothetical protein K2J38_06765 [Muribaculaceae bacterium]|nr:hypothetical protein [Muribaculaceae bacterium]